MSDLGNLTENEVKILKQIRAGEYLSKLRSEQNFTLRDVGSELNISFQYISDIEKGKKSPSDLILHDLARLYKLDIEKEVDLYHRYDRIPLLTEEELESYNSSHIVFAKLKHLADTEQLTEDLHQEFYRELILFFNDFLKRNYISKK